MSAVHTASVPSFSVFDPRLPMLAAKAALQVDQCLVARRSTEFHGQPDLGAVSELGSMLKSAASQSSVAATRRLIDPASIAALSQAIGRFQISSTESSDKFFAGLATLVDTLTSERIKACENQTLEAVRDFFVVLSDLAATDQQMRYRTRPVTPYRK